MTPSDIRAVLERMGARPNKRLGQHFLISDAVLQTIVDAADIRDGDRVLEIGPGLGVLTRALEERGAEVIAIEQDRRLAEFLQSSDYSPIRSNRRIVQGDAAAVHWHELVEDGPWKFVSNLPYSITSLALRKALWAPRPPEKLVVLVQREVGERAVATSRKHALSGVEGSKVKSRKSGKTSLLSLMVALASSSARIVRRVPPGAFYPPPKVESVVLEVIPMAWKERVKRWGVDPEKIMEVARRGFAHPRKLLASNLKLLTTDYSLLPTPKARAEDLSPDQWAELTKAIN